jgi:hypothetical protein
MSATVLTIVNKVMRKLREDTVNSIDGDIYAEQITDLLTEVKDEVEKAWPWQALLGTVLLDTTASAYRYKLQGIYEGSKIMEVYDQTNNRYLINDPNKVKEGLKYPTPDEGKPIYWDYAGWNDDEMLIDIYPVPDVDDIRIYVNGWYPQGDISYTDPDTTYIYTPMNPLVLGTYARAVEERGEDDGNSFTRAEARYRKALGDAIALENALQGERHAQWNVE